MKSQNIKTILLLLALCMLISPLASLSHDEVKEPTPSVSVSSNAEVKASPDIAIISLAIETEGKTAQEAISKNSTQADSLINQLLSLGIQKKDIQTSSISVNPIYKTGQNVDMREKNILAYKAYNSLSTTVRNLDNAGKVIDKAVSVGNTRVYNIAFDIDDKEKYYLEALKLAVEKAKKKAEIAVQAAGSSITGIKKINIDTSYNPYPIYKQARMEVYATADSATPETPVNPGEISITQNVIIEYEIAKAVK